MPNGQRSRKEDEMEQDYEPTFCNCGKNLDDPHELHTEWCEAASERAASRAADEAARS